MERYTRQKTIHKVAGSWKRPILEREQDTDEWNMEEHKHIEGG